jgi:hypothetical protein
MKSWKWTQLNLFNEQTDIDFAMSLTTEQFIDLKHRDEYAHGWIAQIRHVVQRHRSMLKSLENGFQRDLEMASTPPHLRPKRY